MMYQVSKGGLAAYICDFQKLMRSIENWKLHRSLGQVKLRKESTTGWFVFGLLSELRKFCSNIVSKTFTDKLILRIHSFYLSRFMMEKGLRLSADSAFVDEEDSN